MIEFLSDWMRGLILVIFLAVFLDMLLPNDKMQRYVRLVMGLLIILIMLSPILKIYNGVNVYRMDFSLNAIMTGENEKVLPSADEVLAQGAKLSENTSSQTVEQWKTAIAEHIGRTVERDHPVSVKQVEVTFDLDGAGRPQNIAGLHLILTAKQDASAVQPIKPVEPVVIGGGDPAAGQGDGMTASKQPERQTVKAVREQIATDYQLNQADVRVDWHES